MFISSTQQAPDILEQHRIECLETLNQTSDSNATDLAQDRLSGENFLNISMNKLHIYFF